MPRFQARKKKPPVPWKRVLLLVGGMLLAGGLIGGGWYFWHTLPLKKVVVTGQARASEAEVLRLASVTDTLLHRVHPRIVADRVRRHPWVQQANAHRRPDGSLVIRVKERQPVALVLDARGRPERFLDPLGYQMPYQPLPLSLPLVRGLRESYHPIRPVRHASVRRLLRTLARLDPLTHAVLSEFEVEGNHLRLYTVPAPSLDGSGQAIPVRLGDRDFDIRLEKLRAFWDQAVLTRPDVQYAAIDLRFDSQIVTRESQR